MVLTVAMHANIDATPYKIAERLAKESSNSCVELTLHKMASNILVRSCDLRTCDNISEVIDVNFTSSLRSPGLLPFSSILNGVILFILYFVLSSNENKGLKVIYMNSV